MVCNPSSDQWLVTLDARAQYQKPFTPTPGAAVTNFERRLPAADSALARDTLKDPYLFNFLGLGNESHEREIK